MSEKREPESYQDFQKLFDEFLATHSPDSTSQRRKPRPELHIEVYLTGEERAAGIENKEVSYRRMDICERCETRGAEPGSPEPATTCPRCGGTGEIGSTPQATFLGNMVRVIDCPHCNGKGRLIPQPCQDCGGLGYIFHEAAARVSLSEVQNLPQSVTMHAIGDVLDREGKRGDVTFIFTTTKREALALPPLPTPVLEKRKSFVAWLKGLFGF